MTELFLAFFNRSVSALYLVLAVLAVRLVFRRAPKWVSPLLWALVALRLLLPVSLHSSFSLVPESEVIPPALVEAVTPAPGIRSDPPAADSTILSPLPGEETPLPSPAVDAAGSLLSAVSGVWLAGIAVMLTYALVSYLRLRRRVADAVPLSGGLYRSERVASPFILGIMRPRIYLPLSLGGQDLDCVLAHERAHLARRDHWWKPLGFVLLALYWFNPLLWLAYVLFCRDVELACDERVVKTLSASQRADYSQALLSCSVPRSMIAACPVAFGEVGVKERVGRVLSYQKPAVRLVVLSLLACAALAVCFLTDPPRETMR